MLSLSKSSTTSSSNGLSRIATNLFLSAGRKNRGAVLVHPITVRVPSSYSSIRCSSCNSSSSSSISSETTTTSTSSTTTSNRPIYVAATSQHVGKTTTCLALISGLTKRFPHSIGYLKPVGQQHVSVHSSQLDKDIRVDKDVILIKKQFNLHHLDYKDMSPVLIPSGYTKQYIDGKISHYGQVKAIQDAMKNVGDCSEVVLCEGTGHTAVGSIVEMSNAKVAAHIGADMVLVANGGLGSCFDELQLNKALCDHHNVKLAGVIVNKVLPSKYEQTKKYMSRAFSQHWDDVPLLGCIPDKPYLGCPALSDLEKLFGVKLLSGNEEMRFRHYTVQDINLVTTSHQYFFKNLRDYPTRSLYVCHTTQTEMILSFIEYAHYCHENNINFESALLICGREKKYELSPEVYKAIESSSVDIPILQCHVTTHQAMEKIHGLTPKLNIDDKGRTLSAMEHYEQYIDFDLLLKRTGNPLKSQREEA